MADSFFAPAKLQLNGEAITSKLESLRWQGIEGKRCPRRIAVFYGMKDAQSFGGNNGEIRGMRQPAIGIIIRKLRMDSEAGDIGIHSWLIGLEMSMQPQVEQAFYVFFG